MIIEADRHPEAFVCITVSENWYVYLWDAGSITYGDVAKLSQ